MKLSSQVYAAIFLLVSAALTFSYATEAFSWTGPRAKVVYDNKGAGLMISDSQGTKRVPARYFMLNLCTVGYPDWDTIKFELQKVRDNNINIICICIGFPYNPWDMAKINYYNNIFGPEGKLTMIMKELNWKPYIIILPAISKENPQPSDISQGKDKNGNTAANIYGGQTFSASWISNVKVRMQDTVDYLNGACPDRLIGIFFAYYEWFSGPYNVAGFTDYFYDDYNEDVKQSFNKVFHPNDLSRALPSVNERSQSNVGNFLITSKDAIDYNRFLSERTAGAIIDLAKHIKTSTDNKVMTMAYYGYLNELNSYGHIREGASGHIAMKKYMESPYVDMICSPYAFEYSRFGSDALIALGPMDSPGVYKVPNTADPSGYTYKIWAVEDATSTFLGRFTNPQTHQYFGNFAGASMQNTIQHVRRNIITSGLHKTLLYYDDPNQVMGSTHSSGWWGIKKNFSYDPTSNPATDAQVEAYSNQLWQSVSTAQQTVDNMRFEEGKPYVPEVAVFCDDASSAMQMLESSNPDAYANMKRRILSDAVKKLTELGTPIRYYLINDLLQDNFPSDKIKLAIFLNTYRIPQDVREAINDKLKKDGKTLLFTYACGFTKDDDVPATNNIAEITGLPVASVLHTGYNLKSEIINFGQWTQNNPLSFGEMQFAAIPWFYIQATNQISEADIMGKYIASVPSQYRISVYKKSFTSPGTHNVIYSASPDLPIDLYREIAIFAGVNIFSHYYDTITDRYTSQLRRGYDIIEAAGNTVMIYGLPATEGHPVDHWIDLILPNELDSKISGGIDEVWLERDGASMRIESLQGQPRKYQIKVFAGEVLTVRWKYGSPTVSTFTAVKDTSNNINCTATGTPRPGYGIYQYKYTAIDSNGTRWDKLSTTSNASFTNMPVGVYKISAQVQSNDIWSPFSNEVTVTVLPPDTTPPTGSININSGSATTRSASVTLTLQATDAGSGVTHMKFSNDGNAYTSAEAYATTKAYTLPGSAGTKTVYVKYIDGAGNESTAYSDAIVFDNVVPTGSININNGAVTTTTASVTLTLSAADGLSGVTHMKFSNDGNAYTSAEAYATTKAYTLPGAAGTKTVYVKYIDGAGNESTAYSDAIVFDNVVPTGSININNGAVTTTTASVTLTLSAADGLSGVTHMKFSNDGNAYTSAEAYAATKAYTLPGSAGTKTVYVKYIDGAGNESIPYWDAIVFDNTAPTGSININSGAATTTIASVTLTLSAADGLSGVTHMKFSNDGNAYTSAEAYATTKAYTLPGSAGTKTVYVKYIDGAGNESIPYWDAIVFDNTAPTGSININSGAATTTTASVTLTLSAADGLSGVTHMKFSNDGNVYTSAEAYAATKAYTLPGAAGTKTVYVKYIDGAGNVSGAYLDNIELIDEIPPLIISSMSVNDDDLVASSRTATVALEVQGGAPGNKSMCVSCDNSTYSDWEAFDESTSVVLTPGSGPKTVYVKVKDENNNVAEDSDSITLITPMTVGSFDENQRADVVVVTPEHRNILMYLNDSVMSTLQDLEPAGMARCNIDGAGGDELVIGFNKALTESGSTISGFSVCYTQNNDSTFIHSLNPKSFVCADITGDGKDDIIADYGSVYGIWLYDASAAPSIRWQRLHPLTSKTMTVGDMNGDEPGKVVVIDFGDPYGIWCLRNYLSTDWETKWHPMHGRSSLHIVCADITGDGKDEVITDFGPQIGIWIYDLTSPVWSSMPTWFRWRSDRLHGLSAVCMASGNFDGDAAGRQDIAIDFGIYGIWVYVNDSVWEHVSQMSGFNMTSGDIDKNGFDELIVDFGEDKPGVKRGTKIMYNFDSGVWRDLEI